MLATTPPRQPVIVDSMRLLTLSFDDSSYFVARHFAALVESLGITSENVLLADTRNAPFVEENRDNPFFHRTLLEPSLFTPEVLGHCDVLFAAKLKRSFDPLWNVASRPFILVAYPGLELSPATGFANRLRCDGILFNTVADRDAYRLSYPERASQQQTWVGNPTLLRRRHGLVGNEARCDGELFFAQNITPRHRAQRLAILHLLRARGPVTVKVRHDGGAGVGHVHGERHSFRSLAGNPPLVPIASMSMDSALSRYCGYLSCSSTALLEAVAAGRPGAFIKDFEGWQDDLLHVASLGYSLRYGLGISAADLANGAPLPSSPSEAFFEDFGLTAEPEWLKRLAELRAPRRREVAESTVLGPAKQPPGLMAARLYATVGNRHKALFVTLSHCLQHPEDLVECQEWLVETNRTGGALLDDAALKTVFAAIRKQALKRCATNVLRGFRKLRWTWRGV